MAAARTGRHPLAVSVFRPLVQAQTYRDLLFVAAGIPVAAVVLGAVVAGWTSIAVLAITPLVAPVLLGYRGVVGLLARGDATLARTLLGTETGPPVSSSGRGFWGRARAVVLDPNFWRQQGYLLLRMTVGFALAVAELSLIAGAVGWITLPIWYRWTDNDYGSFHVDTLGRALLFVPAGLAVLVATAWLARALGAFSGWQVRTLLAERAEPTSPAARKRARRRALQIDAAVAVALSLLMTLLWAVTGRGYFWPEWVMLPLALLLAIHAVAELSVRRFGSRSSAALAIHGGVVAVIFLFLTAIWAVTGAGHFWPGWVLLGLGSAFAVHALITRRSRALTERVETLETTRLGAIEEQDAELRRIERDLHDGAQARLVALGLSLGMAEQKFATDPEGAQQLVAEARAGVAEALTELRALARGIYPPVLTDRGVGAALRTLADLSPIQTTVTDEVDERPPARVEAAAYFVAAEALANAVKHSGASHVALSVARQDDRLEVTVTDDGGGGADPEGDGLAGLKRRVVALDGTLMVESPAGGPTTIRAELPCGS
jgi:signal transduction histidine kinase